MENDYLTEKLGAIKNEMSHLWGGIFVTGGGAMTIATTGYQNEKVIFIILGLLMTVIFTNAYMIRRKEILDILKLLKKEGK